jgi:hypothetical protein
MTVEAPVWQGAGHRRGEAASGRAHTLQSVTDEQRSQAGWIGGQSGQVILTRAHTLVAREINRAGLRAESGDVAQPSSKILLAAFVGLLGMRAAEAYEGRPFRVTESPSFSHMRSVLAHLVARRGKTEMNRFCVLGQRFVDGDEHAWVYWAEGRAVILWEPTVHQDRADLLRSRRFLRLDRDVVPDEESVRSSTYLVTKDWVRDLLHECRLHGDRFTLGRAGKR